MQILLWFSSTHARQQLSNPRIHLTFPSAGCVVTSRNARLATHDRNGNNHQDMSFKGEEVVGRGRSHPPECNQLKQRSIRHRQTTGMGRYGNSNTTTKCWSIFVDADVRNGKRCLLVRHHLRAQQHR